MGPRGKGTTATRGKPLPNVMSQTEIQNLQEEKKELEHSLKEAEGYGSGTAGEAIDKSKIKAQIAHYDREIANAGPGRMTGRTKDSLAREAKELEEQFKKNMPTKFEMDHPAKCPGAVRKHMAWLNVNEKTGYIERYRTIQRIINPGMEESVESLRKEK
jgi:hypothetical protein